MARDILGEYGRDAHKPQAARATNGGQVPCGDVMNYKPPQGPTNIMDAKSPGLHGANLGNCGTQGSASRVQHPGGSPGLHGENAGVNGTQRRR